MSNNYIIKLLNMRFIVVIALSIIATANNSFSQKPKLEIEKALSEKAQLLLDNENYNDALPLFVRLDSIEPGNIDYTYKTGICYLNARNNRAKALPYFEEVLKNFNPLEIGRAHV